VNKAVTGVFADSVSASRAINDLKAAGFGGETISQVLREDLPRGQRMHGPRIMPALEPLKGLIIGAIVGGILGGLANWIWGIALTWPSLGLADPLLATVVTLAVVGALAGLIEGLFAMGPLARARGALMLRHRGDALVSVHTDESHAGRAAEIMRAAGAFEVRRGASSVPDEFRTAETVAPETYGEAPVIQREPVGSPQAEVETRGGHVG
jgi:hypothetical protein